MKHLYYVGLGIVSFGLAFGVSAAFGQVQDGRVDQNGLYEATLNIDGRSFNVPSGQCIVYATTLTDLTARAQVEAGELQCNNWNFDNNECLSGHMYAEQIAPNGSYFCTMGGTFATWTDYEFEVTHFPGSSTATAYTGDGKSISQGEFAPGDTLQNWTWAEETPGNACGGTGSVVNFNTWSYVGSDELVRWVTNAAAKHEGRDANNNVVECWSIGAQNSTGDFNVTR